MPDPDHLIHLPPSVGGTLLVATPTRYRAHYDTALRRYHGPARLVLCEEAFRGTPQEMERMHRCLAMGTVCAAPYSEPLPGHFSLHCLNTIVLPKRELAAFWRILDHVQAEAHRNALAAAGMTPPTGMTPQETMTWFCLALTACAVSVVAWVLLGALWQYITSS
jgi:hypothetical protein